MAFIVAEFGSAADGEIAEGCKLCTQGAKMVLFVTGLCGTGCFYCPVSFEKKETAGTYANELKIASEEDIISEAESMRALGTGITGGDPLCDMDRTLRYIRMLKIRFGKEHHIHLYTSTMDPVRIRKLAEAGLDEIRFHPGEDVWDSFDSKSFKEIKSISGLDVGIEVPALPGKEESLDRLISSAFASGADFVNLNELEFSESNWDMMERRGYSVKNDTSSAVYGSEETALALLRRHPGKRIHYCSSSFKDGIQLRRRLIRKAEQIAKEYDVVTEEGTLIKGILYAEDLHEAAGFLEEKYGVPPELMHIDEERNRMETASWVLEELAESLPYRCYITEEYPTADRLEVERMPLGLRSR